MNECPNHESRPIYTRGVCSACYKRMRRTGELPVIRPRGLSLRERFDRVGKVRTKGGCWIWQGALSGGGHGTMSCPPGTPLGSGGKIGAHVASYLLHNGPIPVQRVGTSNQAIEVCHSCDVRACVEPKHLWLGTQSDNIQDYQLKKQGMPGLTGREFEGVEDVDTRPKPRPKPRPKRVVEPKAAWLARMDEDWDIVAED